MIFMCNECQTYFLYCVMIDDLCINCKRLKDILIYKNKKKERFKNLKEHFKDVERNNNKI